ncbi:uncharacterized protein EV422DRAFT_527743 [Fimicolochytrium jonesii]|uniref:uncharacterized protein n=1 Tax=Fimicolochytrium jonesii TaxID=1396493 RepID=UPI0022FEEBD9|nr:uncharacterized protein EV422DRAFT_527743 [Fimicolochytrium jonesii]KAI8821333.1 hypothetical protein EV422DRAFT_527743 [Fimicolochytrium jonesii]
MLPPKRSDVIGTFDSPEKGWDPWGGQYIKETVLRPGPVLPEQHCLHTHLCLSHYRSAQIYCNSYRRLVTHLASIVATIVATMKSPIAHYAMRPIKQEYYAPPAPIYPGPNVPRQPQRQQRPHMHIPYARPSPNEDPAITAATMAMCAREESLAAEKLRRDHRRRLSHSAVERRRRERINDKLVHLRALLPSCPAGQEPAHKLTILQGAIDYISYLESQLPGQSAKREKQQLQQEQKSQQDSGSNQKRRTLSLEIIDEQEHENDSDSRSSRATKTEQNSSRWVPEQEHVPSDQASVSDHHQSPPQAPHPYEGGDRRYYELSPGCSLTTPSRYSPASSSTTNTARDCMSLKNMLLF